MSTLDITRAALGQLDHHWTTQLRPRLDGLADDEYRWEPVTGSWNVHPKGTGATPMAAGAGGVEIDFAVPEPTPPPVTTIAWRLGHVIVGVLAMRNADHFGHRETSYQAWDYSSTASGALDQLDEQYARWVSGVRGLDAAAMAEPCHEGEPGGPYVDLQMLELVLHINREVIHHGAEIALLRDLYAHR